jgi:hypothetical protein
MCYQVVNMCGLELALLREQWLYLIYIVLVLAFEYGENRIMPRLTILTLRRTLRDTAV